MRITLLVAPALVCCLGVPAVAQFKKQETINGSKLEPGLTQCYKAGVLVKATGGMCKNIVATVPVPTDWPEQQVQVVAEDLSPEVKGVHYRMLSGTVKQMIVEIPQIAAGRTAKAVITFEIKRSTLLPPDKTDIYNIPKKLDRQLLIYTGPSPYIESRNAKITSLAKELVAEKETAWEQVEALYDWTREHIKYQNGELKGAVRALHDKTGDCEELSSLFIALCRANKIPARTVWVPGHCYSEFYLVDDDGKGHWFACQSAGAKAFGGIPEQRPILQKGDNFRDADRPREHMRYVSPFFKGSGVNGGKPVVTFVDEVVGT